MTTNNECVKCRCEELMNMHERSEKPMPNGETSCGMRTKTAFIPLSSLHGSLNESGQADAAKVIASRSDHPRRAVSRCGSRIAAGPRSQGYPIAGRMIVRRRAEPASVMASRPPVLARH